MLPLILMTRKPGKRQGSYLDIQLMIKTGKRCLMPFQSSFSSMKWQVHKEFSYFQETLGRLANCWGDNESISEIESIFHNVTAFCLSKSTFFTLPREVFKDFNGPTHSLCNCPSVLVRSYLAGVSSQQLHNNSSQLSSLRTSKNS